MNGISSFFPGSLTPAGSTCLPALQMRFRCWSTGGKRTKLLGELVGELDGGGDGLMAAPAQQVGNGEEGYADKGLACTIVIRTFTAYMCGSRRVDVELS